MEINEYDAKKALAEINKVSSDTARLVAGAFAGPILVLWAFIMIIAYLGTHFFMSRAWHIWMVMNAVGIAGTALICTLQLRKSKVTKYQNSSREGWRFFIFWLVVFGYMSIWLNLMKPYSGLQLNAFIVTVIMFAYVIIGLYEGARFMLWLGLLVTAITLAGVYIIPHKIYCLWMAFAGGGAMMFTGIYYWLHSIKLCSSSTK